MSHSQWEKKKYKKAASGAKTSQLFTKLVKLITWEAKQSKGNRDFPGLRTAIQKARAYDMPVDNIERAIKKATESRDMIPVLFEAHGPAGVQFIIEGLTDNTNRTSQEIRHLLSEYEGSLGVPGSVMWNFTKMDGEYIAQSMIEISPEDLQKVEVLIEKLEDHDDIQSVATNLIESES